MPQQEQQAGTVEGMIIQVDKIGRGGMHIRRDLNDTWLDTTIGQDAPFRPCDLGHVDLRLECVDREVVHVCGRASFSVVTTCSRCLGDAVVSIDAPVEVALFPSGKEPPPAVDGEIDENDMGVATYDEGGIDIASLLYHELLLELPPYPLCAELCAGICVNCGVNRNIESCNCEQASQKWNAFQNLKSN